MKFNDNMDISYSNNDDINNNNKKKLYHVERIEQILKKNILENKNDNDINKLSNISQIILYLKMFIQILQIVLFLIKQIVS